MVGSYIFSILPEIIFPYWEETKAFMGFMNLFMKCHKMTPIQIAKIKLKVYVRLFEIQSHMGHT